MSKKTQPSNRIVLSVQLFRGGTPTNFIRSHDISGMDDRHAIKFAVNKLLEELPPEKIEKKRHD